MNSQMKNNLTNADGWIRSLYVLLFLFCLHLASMLMALIALVQIIFNLVTGESNQWLRQFGVSLTSYINNANLFVCHQSNEKPFPFADWPQLPVVAEPAEVMSESVVEVSEAVVEVEVAEPVADFKARAANTNDESDRETDSEKSQDPAAEMAASNHAIDCNADDSHVSDKK